MRRPGRGTSAIARAAVTSSLIGPEWAHGGGAWVRRGVCCQSAEYVMPQLAAASAKVDMAVSRRRISA